MLEGDSGLADGRSGGGGAQEGGSSQHPGADGTVQEQWLRSWTAEAPAVQGQGCVEEAGEAEQMGCMWTLR